MDFCWKQVEEHKKGIRTMYYPIAILATAMPVRSA